MQEVDWISVRTRPSTQPPQFGNFVVSTTPPSISEVIKELVRFSNTSNTYHEEFGSDYRTLRLDSKIINEAHEFIFQGEGLLRPNLSNHSTLWNNDFIPGDAQTVERDGRSSHCPSSWGWTGGSHQEFSSNLNALNSIEFFRLKYIWLSHLSSLVTWKEWAIFESFTDETFE